MDAAAGMEAAGGRVGTPPMLLADLFARYREIKLIGRSPRTLTSYDRVLSSFN